MVSAVISRIVIMVFGTLYPAYSSYKAVKTKNVKEYVKWMMYWIVFAFFTCVETFADIFISWVPFYYELKILFVLWLLSPATKGASILYRKFVHPQLSKREKEIDTYIAKASDQGYSALLNLGSKGINYATNIVLTTAIKGQTKIADHLRKSYSLNDLSQGGNRKFRRDETDDNSDLDDEADNRLIEENYRREMDEQNLDELSESPDRPRSARRRPKSFASDAELHPVMEEEDENDGRPGKSQKYTHKDVKPRRTVAAVKTAKPYHYATVSRSKTRSSTRQSVKKSTFNQ